MDGGGRLLRSIGGWGARFAPSSYAVATAAPLDPFSFPALPKTAPRLPRSRQGRSVQTRVKGLVHSRFLGTMLVFGLFAGVMAYGCIRGGEYEAFVASNGTPSDIAAKAIGFPIKAVTITGARELGETEILRLAGITPRQSLLFLDVAAVRARLKAVPLIKEASVSKLFPNRLLIEVEERRAYALWQKDGAVSIVAADGTPIDSIRDPRFERLPLVVGESANDHLAEYTGVLEAAGELKDRIRAGMYIAGRRWTLKTEAGIEIDLPEKKPEDAIARFAMLEHDGHVLEKDIVSVDLRIPGRVVVRLAAEAAAARADALAKKSKKKGATT